MVVFANLDHSHLEEAPDRTPGVSGIIELEMQSLRKPEKHTGVVAQPP